VDEVGLWEVDVCMVVVDEGVIVEDVGAEEVVVLLVIS